MKIEHKKQTLLFTTNTDSDDISVVDVIRRNEITRIPVGGSPRGSVKFDPDKKFGYVSNCAGNSISVLDLNSYKEVAKIKTGIAPRGLSISSDGNFAFVSNSGSNNVSIIDLKKRKEINQISMGANPRHMFVLSRLNKVLISEWGSDSIGVIDLIGKSMKAKSTKSIPVGKDSRPYSINVTSDEKTAYVANTQASYISIIDIDKNLEKERIEVGYGGRAIVLDEKSGYAYATIENSNQVAIIDLNKNEVVNRIEVGPNPRGIAIDFDLQEIYSSSFTRSGSMFKRNSITVVDIKNPLKAKVIDEIVVGLGPCSVSVLKH